MTADEAAAAIALTVDRIERSGYHVSGDLCIVDWASIRDGRRKGDAVQLFLGGDD